METAAMSSAPSGWALVMARVISVDMALEVQVCCRPSVCPNSWTRVRNSRSLHEGPMPVEDVAGERRSGPITIEDWMTGTYCWPLGAVVTWPVVRGPAMAITPGGSSSKLMTTAGRVIVTLGVAMPPKRKRKVEVGTEFHTWEAARIWLTTRSNVSPGSIWRVDGGSTTKNDSAPPRRLSTANRSKTGV